MASLYKSADPQVQALLRLVEGQVMSYGHDHPESGITKTVARGIAKRVTGNVVSDWARLSNLGGNDSCSGPKATT